VQPDHRPSDEAAEDAAAPPAQAGREPRMAAGPPSFSGAAGGDRTSHAAPVAQSRLRPDELRKLQGALHELGECRKLLDAVLAEPG
jgi:hypothetical protein